jgi:dTDP-4-amino-4,6-dideoxygalactose transaminase
VIPWTSPLAQYRAHEVAVRAAVTRVLESGAYILGGEVDVFEGAFADYCGTAHAVGVGSGTDALILALRALGIGPGDEVITSRTRRLPPRRQFRSATPVCRR